MSETHDHSKIKWIKDELDQVVLQARTALEDYTDGVGDSELMTSCGQYLHQVKGTLQILELHGAVMLAEEMESVANSIADGAISQDYIGHASEALMQGMVRLPDYLEKLQHGALDHPAIILPLINDLRIVRGSDLLSEIELAAPEIEQKLTRREDVDEEGSSRLPRVVNKLRHRYHLCLLKWFYNTDPIVGIEGLRVILERLQDVSGTGQVRSLFQVARAALAAPLEDLENPNTSLKLLFGKVDRELKRIIKEGERPVAEAPTVSTMRDLLYHVAHVKEDDDLVKSVKKEFELDSLAISQQLVEQGRESLALPNSELMESLKEAISSELSEIKDVLDLFIRTKNSDSGQLQSLEQPMSKVADTLGMIGHADLCQRMKSQADKIKNIATAGAVTNESDLLEIAGDIVFVEASLENLASFVKTQIIENTQILDHNKNDAAEAGQITNEELLPGGEFDRLTDSVVREASVDMAKIKDAILAYIKDPKKSQVLEKVPQHFYAIAGAFEILKMFDVSGLLRATAGYVSSELITHKTIPDVQRLNAFADAITSIEYFMETIADGRGVQNDILDVAREALVRLGTEDDQVDEDFYASAAGEESIPGLIHEDDMDPMAERTDSQSKSDDVVRFTEAQDVEVLQEHTPSAEKPSLEEIDPEILDIFVEEAREELEVIREYVAKWLADEDDTDALITFRRSFHTLKGSGRLVGAKVIGEFAWAIENMLNRVIDQTLEASNEVADILSETIDVLPVLIDYQARGLVPEVDVQPMIERAQNLAAPDYSAAPTCGTVVDLEIVDVDPVPDTDSEEEVEDDTSEYVVETEDDTESGAEPAILLDPVLHEIFVSESRTHIDTINSFLNRCKEMGGVCNLESEVSRAFHTLHGSAHMAGVDPIAEVSAALESYVNEMQEQDKVVDSNLLGLIERADNQFDTILQAINVPGADIPDWQGLLKDIDAAHENILTQDEEPEDLEDAEPQDEITVLTEDFEEPEDLDLESPDVIEPMPHEVELQHSDEQDHPPVVESEPEIELKDVVEHLEAGIEQQEDDVQSEPEAELKEEVVLAETLTPAVDEAQKLMDAEVQFADDDLISIFIDESLELMDDVDHALITWNDEPANKHPVQELQRTLHTLKGGARLAGIQEIGDLSHALESLIADVERDKIANSTEVRALAQSVSDGLMGQIEQASEGGQVDAADEMIAEIKEFISGEHDKAASVVDDATEQELQYEVDEEPEAQVEVYEAEEDPLGLEDEQVELKEEAVDLEVEKAEIEDELVELEEEPVEIEVEPVDQVEEPVEIDIEPADQVDEPEDDGQLEEEDESNDLQNQVLQFPEQEEKPEQITDEEVQPEEVELARPLRRSGREYLRVNPDIMDKLVNNAGEVSIFRSRLEQQSGSMGYSIDEMKNTVDRLRDQLRKLDMETEAQILFRYERDKEEGKLDDQEEFDPLELDRFSTLQQLSRGLMETVGDLSNINKILESEQKGTETLLLQQSRITTDLQDGLMRTRMVSFNQLVPRLQRIVRQTCRPLDKQAELVIKGAEMEIDRSILDRMTAPLEHLLRNAVSHGIETPKKRKKKEKPESGTITIDLSRDGNDVVLTVADDGKGLDFKAIKQRAESKGLLVDGAGASDGDLTQFILEHGFSTTESVNQISGRGVGLDVVVSEVKQLGGTMDIDSGPGAGTKFIIYLPLTLAITDALLLRVGSEIYAAPYANVESVVRVTRDELKSLYEEDEGIYSYDNREFTVKYLGSLLGTGKPNLAEQKKRIPMMLVRAGKHRVAMHVDEIIGHRQIVVKSVGPQLSTIRWITGGTILGDGRVALILDINALVRKDASMAVEIEEPVQIISETVNDKIKIMVVDDSITVRKVTGRLLERHGMAVETAKDGVEALAMLQDYRPDIMLLDIEMPRMDGFEVARNMRNSEELSDIPIIIITSRTGDKHRDHAMDLGVKRYLGKPYQETDLIENIQDVLEESKQ